MSGEPTATFRKCVLIEVDGARYYCIEAVISLFPGDVASVEPAEGHGWEQVRA